MSVVASSNFVRSSIFSAISSTLLVIEGKLHRSPLLPTIRQLPYAGRSPCPGGFAGALQGWVGERLDGSASIDTSSRFRLASTSRCFDECFKLLEQRPTDDLIERIVLFKQLLLEIRDRLAVAELCKLERTLQRDAEIQSAIIQASLGEREATCYSGIAEAGMPGLSGLVRRACQCLVRVGAGST